MWTVIGIPFDVAEIYHACTKQKAVQFSINSISIFSQYA